MCKELIGGELVTAKYVSATYAYILYTDFRSFKVSFSIY
jgi:hypothetical protein